MNITAVTTATTTTVALPWEARNVNQNFQKCQEEIETAAHKAAAAFLPPLSAHSFRAVFTFRLSSPYFSGRDRSGSEHTSARVDLAHNRVCREWVSGFPLVKGSAWKRFFRSLWPGDEQEKELLFGPRESEDSDNGNPMEDSNRSRGIFKFHYAVFRQFSIKKTMINPRDSRTGKGTLPITYETVPKDSVLQEVVIDYLPPQPDHVKAKAFAGSLLAVAARSGEQTIGGKAAADFGHFTPTKAIFHPGSGLALNCEELQNADGEAGQIEIIVVPPESGEGRSDHDQHS